MVWARGRVKDMALVVIQIDESKLPKHTKKEFIEWVKYSVGHVASIPLSNPLNDEDLVANVKELSCAGDDWWNNE